MQEKFARVANIRFPVIHNPLGDSNFGGDDGESVREEARRRDLDTDPGLGKISTSCSCRIHADGFTDGAGKLA